MGKHAGNHCTGTSSRHQGLGHTCAVIAFNVSRPSSATTTAMDRASQTPAMSQPRQAGWYLTPSFEPSRQSAQHCQPGRGMVKPDQGGSAWAAESTLIACIALSSFLFQQGLPGLCAQPMCGSGPPPLTGGRLPVWGQRLLLRPCRITWTMAPQRR